MSILFYRRPNYLAPIYGPLNPSDCQQYVERAKGTERSIPAGLSFEQVLSNRPLPPCSLNDLMDYLVYIEHSAENLQFYLCYREYLRRWNALPSHVKALSPEVRADQSDLPTLTKQKSYTIGDKVRIVRPKVVTESLTADGKTFYLDEEHSEYAASSVLPFPDTSTPPTDADISTQAGLNWQPFTIQPNREECNQIARHYLALNSPRELNLSHRDRGLVLHALQHTTHPSAFAPAVKVAEATLRGQSHPNFIRWSICNGNKPRILAVRALGIANMLAGFYIAIGLTLSHASRYYRLFAAIPWLVGFTTIFAAFKGLCMILHHKHTRNLRPWEYGGIELNSVSATIRHKTQPSDGSRDLESGTSTLRPCWQPAWMSTFGPKNSYEAERCLGSYERKPLLKKIFLDDCVWTQEEALRLLQDRIVRGAHLWGLIITVPLTVIFTALPNGNLFQVLDISSIRTLEYSA